MKNNKNEPWLFSAIAGNAKSSASVKGRSKFSLLSFVLVALFSINFIGANAQGGNPDTPTPMLRQFEARSLQFDKMFNDESNNRLILTYVKDVTVLVNKGIAQDLEPGVKVLFFDKKTADVTVPNSLLNAKHVFMYEGKLFYILDTVNIYSYDLKTGEVKLLLTANDRIMGFWNMPGSRILVNARTGGSPTSPYALATQVYKLSIYDYENSTITNITDLPNIYQAFSVGNKIVYLESGSWFNKPGVAFRANVYDLSTGQTYSRTDFNILCLNIPTSDSTFILWYNPTQGGAWRMANVNVNKDLVGNTFNKEDVLEVGGFWAPPIAGGGSDPYSPSPYFMNNESVKGGSWHKDLRTNKVSDPSFDEVWAMNLSTFNFSLVGKFKDYLRDWPVTGGYVVDGKFVSPNGSWLYTSKLYGETNAVKSVKLSGVSVYPNPAASNTNITIPGNGSVEVYNSTSQVIFSQNFTGTISVPVNSGLNIVRVTIGTQTQIFKVLGK
jgi:hypothetical protein